MRKLFICLLALVCGGCASLNREECVTGDWYGIGYRDGVQGRVKSQVARHQKACSEYQIKLDLEEYMRGREQGLRGYCTPGNGYRQGVRGAGYNYVCPREYEADFLTAYKRGRELYLQEQEVKRLEQELKELQADEEDLDDKIKQTEATLVADGITKAQRQRLLNELRSYEKQKLENRVDYHILISELRRERLQLDRLQLAQ
ncbi:MAG: hypothetical protein CSB34_06810 [Desulfobulbus propionicus]|nr:MAG: hypothetical protein CSB34_06810 [Desulfobulbus propionicus]